MQYIVTKKEMQEIDDYAINRIGIPAEVLMERAALQIADQIEKRNPLKGRILIAVEGGNNGGDGLATARILLERGYPVDIFYIGGLKTSAQFNLQKNILSQMGIRLKTMIPNKEYSVIVDGIFGVGLSREIEGPQKKAIEKLNRMNAVKIAIDIPSGIDATTGKILGTAFHADDTVTFGFKKLGMFFSDGIDYCGNVICKEIGFPEAAVKKVRPQVYAYDDLDRNRLPKRYGNSNKGTYGRVAVIAGSKNMSGAAFLCGKAAYCVGAGLVKIYTHESNRTIIQSQLPEAVMMTYYDEADALACIEDVMKWSNVIVAGPGMGMDKISECMLCELLMNVEVPLVVDADALNILSNNIELLHTSSVPMVITPHMKEMSRLVGKSIPEIVEDRFQTARKFAKKMEVILVLKDAKSIVTDGGEQTYMNLSGNNGMSTGGSGDVLSGMIAGMVAGGLPLFQAAETGVYLHGLAGDKAAQKKGPYAMLASDVISCLGEIMR